MYFVNLLDVCEAWNEIYIAVRGPTRYAKQYQHATTLLQLTNALLHFGNAAPSVYVTARVRDVYNFSFGDRRKRK